MKLRTASKYTVAPEYPSASGGSWSGLSNLHQGSSPEQCKCYLWPCPCGCVAPWSEEQVCIPPYQLHLCG